MFISKKISVYTRIFEQNSPFSIKLSLSRSSLALSTLLTFLFNSTSVLFPSNIQETVPRSYIGSINLFHLFFHDNIPLLKIFSIIVLSLVIIGWRPRFTGILHWWVSYTFFTMSDIVDGGDQINTILCFILIPITIMDNRKNHWILSDNTDINNSYKNIMGNTLFLIASVQMSYLYFQSLIEKLKINQWVDGTSLYYWLTHNIFGAPEWIRFLIMPLLFNGLTLVLITWAVLFIEMVLFAAIFMSNSRKVKILFIGIMFHLSIAIVHGLISFFLSMTAGLILYLLPSETKYNVLFLNFINKLKTFFIKFALQKY